MTGLGYIFMATAGVESLGFIRDSFRELSDIREYRKRCKSIKNICRIEAYVSAMAELHNDCVRMVEIILTRRPELTEDPKFMDIYTSLFKHRENIEDYKQIVNEITEFKSSVISVDVPKSVKKSLINDLTSLAWCHTEIDRDYYRGLVSEENGGTENE